MTPVPDAPARRGRTGTAGGLASVLIWSFAAPVVASVDAMDPFLYVAFGEGIGALVFVLIWLARRHNPLAELRSIPPWFYGLGLLGISVHNLTWVAALQQAPPLEATLLIYTWPLLVIIFTIVSLGQRFRWFHLLAGLTGLAGVGVLLLGRGLSLDGLHLQSGHAWALVCALSWSVFSAISARYPKRSSNFLAVVFVLSAVINGAVWFFYRGAAPASGHSLLIAGGAAIFFALAYAMWDFAMKHGNAQLVGVISFLTPALSACYLVILGKAALTPYLALSLALIVAGIGIARHGERRDGAIEQR